MDLDLNSIKLINTQLSLNTKLIYSTFPFNIRFAKYLKKKCGYKMNLGSFNICVLNSYYDLISQNTKILIFIVDDTNFCTFTFIWIFWDLIDEICFMDTTINTGYSFNQLTIINKNLIKMSVLKFDWFYFNQNSSQNQILTEKYSLHRLILTSALVTQKFYSDIFYSNHFFAQKCNFIDVKELNALEEIFLDVIDWKITVDLDEYDLYLSGLDQFFL